MNKFATKAITADLDKIAEFFQNHGEEVGVPSRIAMDFAYRCDLLSDAIEKTAGEEEAEEEEAEEEEAEEEAEEEESKKAFARKAAINKLNQLVRGLDDNKSSRLSREARQAIARLNRLAEDEEVDVEDEIGADEPENSELEEVAKSASRSPYLLN